MNKTICLSVCLSACLPACLSVYPSIPLAVEQIFTVPHFTFDAEVCTSAKNHAVCFRKVCQLYSSCLVSDSWHCSLCSNNHFPTWWYHRLASIDETKLGTGTVWSCHAQLNSLQARRHVSTFDLKQT